MSSPGGTLKCYLQGTGSQGPEGGCQAPSWPFFFTVLGVDLCRRDDDLVLPVGEERERDAEFFHLVALAVFKE